MPLPMQPEMPLSIEAHAGKAFFQHHMKIQLIKITTKSEAEVNSIKRNMATCYT
jgi:hypothetical protein